MGVHRSPGAWNHAHVCLIPALLSLKANVAHQRCDFWVVFLAAASSSAPGGKFHIRPDNPCVRLKTSWSGIDTLAFCLACTKWRTAGVVLREVSSCCSAPNLKDLNISHLQLKSSVILISFLLSLQTTLALPWKSPSGLLMHVEVGDKPRVKRCWERWRHSQKHFPSADRTSGTNAMSVGMKHTVTCGWQ